MGWEGEKKQEKKVNSWVKANEERKQRDKGIKMLGKVEIKE